MAIGSEQLEWLHDVRDAGLKFVEACQRCQRDGNRQFWEVLIEHACGLAALLEKWPILTDCARQRPLLAFRLGRCLGDATETSGPSEQTINRERSRFLGDKLAEGYANSVENAFCNVLDDVGLCLTYRNADRIDSTTWPAWEIPIEYSAKGRPAGVLILPIRSNNRSDRLVDDRVNDLRDAIDDLRRELLERLDDEVRDSVDQGNSSRDAIDDLLREVSEMREVSGEYVTETIDKANIRDLSDDVPPPPVTVLASQSKPSMGSRSINDDAMLSCSRLAELSGDNPESLRKRLQRWRKRNDDGWIENTERGPNDPHFIYRYGSVKHLLSPK